MYFFWGVYEAFGPAHRCAASRGRIYIHKAKTSGAPRPAAGQKVMKSVYPIQLKATNEGYQNWRLFFSLSYTLGRMFEARGTFHHPCRHKNFFISWVGHVKVKLLCQHGHFCTSSVPVFLVKVRGGLFLGRNGMLRLNTNDLLTQQFEICCLTANR